VEEGKKRNWWWTEVVKATKKPLRARRNNSRKRFAPSRWRYPIVQLGPVETEGRNYKNAYAFLLETHKKGAKEKGKEESAVLIFARAREKNRSRRKGNLIRGKSERKKSPSLSAEKSSDNETAIETSRTPKTDQALEIGYTLSFSRAGRCTSVINDLGNPTTPKTSATAMKGQKKNPEIRLYRVRDSQKFSTQHRAIRADRKRRRRRKRFTQERGDQRTNLGRRVPRNLTDPKGRTRLLETLKRGLGNHEAGTR